MSTFKLNTIKDQDCEPEFGFELMKYISHDALRSDIQILTHSHGQKSGFSIIYSFLTDTKIHVKH